MSEFYPPNIYSLTPTANKVYIHSGNCINCSPVIMWITILEIANICCDCDHLLLLPCKVLVSIIVIKNHTLAGQLIPILIYAADLYRNSVTESEH